MSDEVLQPYGDTIVVRRHAPQVAPLDDAGHWMVYCAACSAEAGDYIYPCKVKPDAREPSGAPFWPPKYLNDAP